MGKKYKKCLEELNRTVRYNLRERKNINYCLTGRNFIRTFKCEIKEEPEKDSNETDFNINWPLNRLQLKEELLDTTVENYNHSGFGLLAANTIRENVSNSDINGCLTDIKLEKQLTESDQMSIQNPLEHCDKLTSIVKQEPLSQSSINLTPQPNEGDISEVFITDSSAVKKENSTKNRTFYGEDNEHQYSLPCAVNSTDNNPINCTTVFETCEVDPNKKPICNGSVKKEVNIFEKLKTEKDVTCANTHPAILKSSDCYENYRLHSVSSVDVFKPPAKIIKKVVLEKQKKLSVSERDRIEEERDNVCRKFAAKSGGIWRRLPPISKFV